MIKQILLAGAAMIAFSSAANAALIDVTGGITANPASYSVSKGGTLSPNIDLTDTSDLALSPGSGIGYAGSGISGIAQSPKGPLYDNTYLAVTAGFKATFTLGANVNSFGFTWGSIDPGNTVLITDSRGVTYKITGAQMLSQISSPVAGTSQSQFEFTDPYASITKVVLTSTTNSFEAANFSTSAVPLPTSAIMFGLALAGLGFVSYRRKQQTASI